MYELKKIGKVFPSNHTVN